jgi:hypothetical protein
MSPAPQSGDSRFSGAELRALFQQFTEAVSTDKRISQQLTAWSEARRRWRANWTNRGAASAERTFQLLIPNPTSAGGDHWVHPVADETPELDAWKALWGTAAPAERNEFAAVFVRAVAQIESGLDSVAGACSQLAGSAGRRGLPLAALTPALSALDPVRFYVVCDVWLRALSQYEGAQVPSHIDAYPEVNAIAIRWLAAAEGESPAPVFVGCPQADRFGLFCSWVVRTTSDATKARAFDVTRKKYKEWPPMW